MSRDEDERLREDAAAWLLGALSEDEAREFAREMESSGIARAEIEELREAADALPFAVDPVAPPPELRDRIMAIVESEAELLHATVAIGDGPEKRRRERRWGWLRPAPLAALACTLLLAGVAAGVLIAGSGDEPARTVAAEVTGMPDASGRLEISDGRAELLVDGMRSAPPGHVYQVWVLHEGQTEPVPGALFDTDRDGRGTTALPDVDDVATVMVSVEPEGGSEQPTTEPVLSASLS